MPTIRQQMTALLSAQMCEAGDISRRLGISEKEVYIHLPHIQRTLAADGRRLHVKPAMCLACGYVFSKRSRFTRPGRCVRCKSQRITDPAYQIIQRRSDT